MLQGDIITSVYITVDVNMTSDEDISNVELFFKMQ